MFSLTPLLSLFALATPTAAAETWSMEVQVVTLSKDPHPLSKTGWQEVRTTTRSLVEMQQNGPELEWTSQTCEIEISPVRGVRTKISTAFVDAIPLQRWTGRIEGSDFAAGPTRTIIGAAGAELSQASDDDDDGHPGVSVQVSHPIMGKGEVYVSQVSTTTLDGQRMPDGRIVGAATAEMERRVHGASHWWLTHELPQRSHPDGRKSWFEMVPTDGTRCDAVEWPERPLL